METQTMRRRILIVLEGINALSVSDYTDGRRFGFSRQKLAFQYIANKIRVALHLHLQQASAAVSTNGLYAHMQNFSNIGKRLAGSNHPHHLKLPVGEQLMWLLDRRQLDLAG